MQFRYRPGTWNASDMTSAYAIDNWAVQADQGAHQWFVASPSEMAREYDRVIADTLDHSVGVEGSYNLTWYFALATAGMLDYAIATLFPTDGLNEVATIVTRTPRGWKCLNITAHYTQPADTGQTKPRGLAVLNWQVRFTDGTLANSGGSHSLAHNISHNIGGIPA